MGYRQALVIVGLLCLIIGSSRATAGPVPVLRFLFDDVSGSTVPNHGTLGAAGNATIYLGTTFGWPPGYPDSPAFHGATMIVNDNTDRVYTADLDSLDTLDAFTLAFWVKPTTLATWRGLMGDCDPSPPNAIRGWNLETGSADSSQLQLRLWDGSAMGSLVSPTGTLAAGEWQHITVVAERLTTPGTRTVSAHYYRDGDSLGTASYSTDRQVGNDDGGFTIGNAMWDSSLLAEYGYVAFFDRALTADQVEHHYLSTIPEPHSMVLLVPAAIIGICRRRRRRASWPWGGVPE